MFRAVLHLLKIKSVLSVRPGVRPSWSHDTPGGTGNVTVHPQRGSSQAAGQEPPDIHPADHQAHPHCSAGVRRHSAASTCCSTPLRLHQRQRCQGWVYVHTHPLFLLSSFEPTNKQQVWQLCPSVMFSNLLKWVQQSLFFYFLRYDQAAQSHKNSSEEQAGASTVTGHHSEGFG